MDSKQLDQDHHRNAGEPVGDSEPKFDLIPYLGLPTEILRADGTCHVTMFSAGITTVVNTFVGHENATDPNNHLTEKEWLKRFTQFVVGLNNKPQKT